MKPKLVEKNLFVRNGLFWRFPRSPKPKIVTCGRVKAVLPLYLTYPEFLQHTESSLVSSQLPCKDEALQVCWQIKVPKDDFLANAWMKHVFKIWAESLSPEFAFKAECSNVRYWWCKVPSAKGGRDLWTYLILAVDAEGKLLRYAFYSAGERNDDGHYYLIRAQKGRYEKEEIFSSAKTFIASVCKLSRKGDHFICMEKARDEYVQAIINRDGTFCLEYQMYHMPWQFESDGRSMKDVLRLLRLFLRGGTPAISNETGWTLCEHNRRAPFDLGVYLKKKLAIAVSSGDSEIVDTLRAVVVTTETETGQFVCPVFLNRRGRPVHWNTTLYYLPKSTSKKIKTLIQVCAALEKDPWPHDLHELGEVFSSGCAVRRNYALALFWEKKALRYGSVAARHEVSRLKAILDPQRERKSAKRRERLLSKIAVALHDFSTGKRNRESTYDLVYDVLIEAECDLHDGRITKQDGRAVLRQCDCVLMGIDDGSIFESQSIRPNLKSSRSGRPVAEMKDVFKWI